MKKKSAGPAIDWEAVKDRLEQNRLSWGKPPEDDPRRLAAIMEGRERQLSERRRRGRARREETPFLIFSLGPERYGMALKDLAEVAPFRAVAPLPQAPAGLLGVMNLRGVVLSVMDLAALLGLPVAADRPAGFVLVTRGDAFSLGFRVDEVTDIRRIASDGMSRPSETASPYAAGLAEDQTVILSRNALLTHPLINDKETADE